MTFNERVKNIANENKNLNVIDDSKQGIIVSNTLTKEAYLLFGNDTSFSMRMISNGFETTVYEDVLLPLEDLEKFLTKDINYYYKEAQPCGILANINEVENALSLPSLLENKNLSLLGVFSQPTCLFEENSNGEISEYMREIVDFYVLDESTNKKYIVSLMEGELKENSYGEIRVICPDDIKLAPSLEKSLYIPNEKVSFSVEKEDDKLQFFIQDSNGEREMLGEMSTSSNGYVDFLFKEGNSKHLSHNKNIESSIASLTPIVNISEYQDKEAIISFISATKGVRHSVGNFGNLNLEKLNEISTTTLPVSIEIERLDKDPFEVRRIDFSL